MTLPTLTTFTAGNATIAKDVFDNDLACRNTFGALDIATNINDIYSPMIIGPVRRFFHDRDELEGDSHIIWKAPDDADLECFLRELTVSVMESPPGAAARVINSGNYAGIAIETLSQAQLDAGPGAGAATLVSGGTARGLIAVNSASDFTVDLGDVRVGSGDYVRVFTSALVNDGSAMLFYASISVLAYMKHRTD